MKSNLKIIDEIMKTRKDAGKNTWWFYQSSDGSIKAKGWGTWCQRIIVHHPDNPERFIKTGTTSESTIEELKQQLMKILEYRLVPLPS